MNDTAITPFDATAFFKRFSHGTFDTGETRLHYVAGGEGEPLLLVPGWPQSWYCWRYVMPLLADAGRRVIAVDLRGMGDSSVGTRGYDTGTLAADLAALVASLGEDPVDIVAHDVGSWVCYALACDHPARVRRLALFDALIPGLPVPAGNDPAPSPAKQAAASWHFSFNLLADLPEILLTGREAQFLDWLFDNKTRNTLAINARDRQEYLRVNKRPGALRAALSYYREAFSETELRRTQQRSQQTLTLPVLAGGAAQGSGHKLQLSLQARCERLEAALINCGHYIPEEAPTALVRSLSGFYARYPHG
ncbi:MAG: alpha/beta hydrolase [Pseudomonadota bacterium]